LIRRLCGLLLIATLGTPLVASAEAADLATAPPSAVGSSTVGTSAAALVPRKVVTTDAAYVESLVERAHSLRLAEQDIWRRLGHWRHGFFGGFHTQADADEFFLSKNGKDDPSAELDATLRGFFGPDLRNAPPNWQHPFCKFPARLAWLNAQLGFDFTRVPRRSCPRFQEFVHQLRARSITFVFSSYYLNNPSSAFGHTFLRINKDDRRADQTDLELLDYGIDFSATVDTDNALIYAIKGLTGMYPGVYRRVPYYLKVREYNDHDSRDLWEYELNLTQAEVSMVVAHLWELGSNYFDYFYLSENCSYHVLDALEVASPRLHLIDRVGWPVIPADTVKAIVAEPGLVRAIHFRPSLNTQLVARFGALDSGEQTAVLRLAESPAAPLDAAIPPPERVKLLDTALDLADFRSADDLTKPEALRDPEADKLKQKLLERRAAIPIESEPLVVAPPFRKMPHLGHGSSRVGLGVGRASVRGYYYTAEARVSLHDLGDARDGYPETAAIEFMPFRLRYYDEQQRVSVEDFSLIRVTSLSPMTRFDHSWSWTVRAGGERGRDAGCRECFAGLGEFGAGWSSALFSNSLVLYTLADAQLLAPVEGGLFHALRAGIGPSGGGIFRFASNFIGLATADWLWLPHQTPTSTWRADATLRWEYVHDFALDLHGTAQPDAWSAQIQSMIYF